MAERAFKGRNIWSYVYETVDVFVMQILSWFSQCIGQSIRIVVKFIAICLQVVGSKLPQGKVNCFPTIHMTKYVYKTTRFLLNLNVKNAFCIPEIVDLQSRKCIATTQLSKTRVLTQYLWNFCFFNYCFLFIFSCLQT